ncbi:MAG: response regulator [Symploca sp. SIO2E9]|nr:response regulator [Symploca sp. SIO2E9]
MSRALVVEDSITQRETISTLLREIGLSVIYAKDGVEALEQVQNYHPELVVLDILLPKMNGYEVCRRLKSKEKTPYPIVVMCSGKGEQFDHYWGIKQGADAYISKPFLPQDLVCTVKYLLREIKQPEYQV